MAGEVNREEHGERAGTSGGSSQGQVTRAVQRRKLAGVYAMEMCELSAGVWPGRASGSVVSQVAYVDDDPELGEIVAQAWELAREHPSAEQVSSQPGVAGRVVVAHGPTWSVIGRSGGPILVMSDQFADVVRIDGDPDWQPDLTAMVSELINASQGLPAFDESQIPPMPPLPWHRPPG